MTGWIVLIAFGAVFLMAVLYVVGIYNRLVTLKNRFQNAFAQIEVQLKRRYDLIPNLVETAKGYMSHERETLEAVIAARNQALAGLEAAAATPGGADAMKQLAGAEGALSGALGRLSVVVEQYPDLKANQNMMQLSEELTSTENKVAFSRQAFNDAVTATTPTSRPSRRSSSRACSDMARTRHCWSSRTAQKIQEAPKVSFSS